jgi:hypothetical protein
VRSILHDPLHPFCPRARDSRLQPPGPRPRRLGRVSGQTFRSRAEESLFQTQQWLRTEHLTVETLPIDFRDAQTGEQLPDPTHMVMTLPTSRAQAHKKRELESLTKQWRSSLSKEPFRATQAAEKPAVQTPSSAALDDLLDRNPNLFADLRRLRKCVRLLSTLPFGAVREVGNLHLYRPTDELCADCRIRCAVSAENFTTGLATSCNIRDVPSRVLPSSGGERGNNDRDFG